MGFAANRGGIGIYRMESGGIGVFCRYPGLQGIHRSEIRAVRI
jgi:hypothetical protein